MIQTHFLKMYFLINVKEFFYYNNNCHATDWRPVHPRLRPAGFGTGSGDPVTPKGMDLAFILLRRRKKQTFLLLQSSCMFKPDYFSSVVHRFVQETGLSW